MRQFHELTVERIEEETPDSRRVCLGVPEALRETFAFVPGQHLPVQITNDGKHVRRTYSICSAPGAWPLEIGVRVQPQGQFSGFVGRELATGDTLEVMPPFGRFHAEVDAANAKTYLMLAAGSGITPILSIVRALLEGEPASRIVLFYGNREQRTTMFIDDLYALKNRFPERVQLCFLFSREQQEFPIFGGRLDADKIRELYTRFCAGLEVDEAFLCGPGTMIDVATGVLRELGVERLHVERYGPPGKAGSAPDPVAAPDAGAGEARITVIMDGHRKTFPMASRADSIVEGAARHGLELPYSCKGGVCATCRTFVREGEVRMDSNLALERWEVEKGFVLACQSHPVSDEVVLDYDET